MRVLGIIPARGGSKSVPMKNIRTLGGFPLITYAIRSALQSDSLDRVVVTSNSTEILEISTTAGARTIQRPPELATDESPTEASLLHVLEVLEKEENYVPDIVLTLEPTSPFRSLETINKCVEAFKDPSVDSVVGVRKYSKRLGYNKDGLFSFIFPNHKSTPRRQDRETLLEECGVIWGTRTKTLKETKLVFGENIFPLIIPEREIFDINDEYDFILAEERLVRDQLEKGKE